jgi:hypothetical protein
MGFTWSMFSKKDEIQWQLLCYVNFQAISQMKIHQAPEATRKLIVYADNAHIHLTKLVENFLVIVEMSRARHLLYSQDLMPSDFCLFDHMKQIMAGQSLSRAKELLSAIGAILNNIGKAIFVAIFRELMERLA